MKGKSMKLDVIYQFNEKYAPYAGASITSLFENNRHLEKIRVFILGEGLSEDSLVRFSRMEEKYGREFIFIDTVELVEQMKQMGLPPYRGSYAANMRLFLPHFIDDSVDRLLYLDADTVVVDRLDPLIEMEMGDYPIAMALDSIISDARQYLGIRKEEDYFNSGVILFKLTKWKELKLSDKIADYVRNTRAIFSSPDQDLLNLVCKGKIQKLGPRFNLQPMHIVFSTKDYYKKYIRAAYYPQEVVEEQRKSPVIIHFFRFMGEFPWHENNVHPDNDLFDKYIQKSEWADYVKQPADTNYAMKIEKILYRILPRSLFLPVFRIAHDFLTYKTENAVKNGKYFKLYQG